MPVFLQTTLLLICSNVFMTFAWYAHLKDMGGRPWRAVVAMQQPFEQICQATGIHFKLLADFIAGGQLGSVARDRFTAAARCELTPRPAST